MIRSILVVIGVIALVGAAANIVVSAEPQKSSDSKPLVVSTSPEASQRALLNRYCVICHNEKLKTAGLMLDKLDVGKCRRARKCGKR